MRPREQGWFTDTMRLDDEVTLAIGNISGQQLCLSIKCQADNLQVQEKRNMQPSGRLDNGADNRDYMPEDIAGLFMSYF